MVFDGGKGFSDMQRLKYGNLGLGCLKHITDRNFEISICTPH